MSLTYVNQVGAAQGMNQASPGSFIPETFVRWAQDILFDRVGYLRRRAPFELFKLYNTADVPTIAYPNIINERVISLVSTLNPNGNRITGFIVGTDSATRVLFYDGQFRNTAISNLVTISRDTIFDCKQASNGGMWLSFMTSYRPAETNNEYYQYYWYGGASVEQTIQNTRFGCKHTSNVKHRTFTNKIYAPEFTVTNSEKTNDVVTLTFAAHTISLGDSITVNMSDTNFDGTFIVTGVTSTTITYAFAGTDVSSGADTGTVTELFDTVGITPGTFVYVEYSDLDYYTGMVKAVSTSEVTLEKDAIRWRFNEPVANMSSVAVAGSSPNERLPGVKIKFRNMRPYIHQHGRGLITRDTATTTTVISGALGTDGEGHFQSADLAGVNLGVRWGLYRASDGEWIGDINAATNNTTIALNSNHHTNETDTVMRADEYVCWPYLSVPSATISEADPTRVAGIFNTTYAGYQWFGNAGNVKDKNRIVFSAYNNPEAVDLSKDAADSIIISGSNEMRGLASSIAGLLIFTDDKTYILRGNYRSNFSLEELYPVGCLSSMSIVEYGGGVFWASRLGIMYYDGASVRNLTEDSLGVYYTDSIRPFNTNVDRIYSFLHKDYLFVHFSAFASVFKPERYEPVYPEGILTTPAIANFSADDWDSDFTPDDFKVENNVPIYWNRLTMYKSTSPISTKIVPRWGTTGTPFKWGERGSQYVWGPVRKSEGVTFAIYLPTNAVTTISNFDFRGATKLDASSGVKAITGVNALNATFTVTNKKLISNVATITVTEQGIPNGVGVVIRGVDSVFDGEYTVTSVTGNEFTFAKTANDVGSVASAGTVTIKGIPVNSITPNAVYPRIIDVDSILETSNAYTTSVDAELLENVGKEPETYYLGPDFYLQTKHYTVGDPVLRKWFRQVMINLYLLDGSMRLDIVDLEDNDSVDITKKKAKNWAVFEEAGYSWDVWQTRIVNVLASPNRPSWSTVESLGLTWFNLVTAEFERRKKNISWRYPSAGFRLYQMNKYRPRNYQVPQRAHTIMIDSWNIGFKPLRQSRL
jgi:hypothetical protein